MPTIPTSFGKSRAPHRCALDGRRALPSRRSRGSLLSSLVPGLALIALLLGLPAGAAQDPQTPPNPQDPQVPANAQDEEKPIQFIADKNSYLLQFSEDPAKSMTLLDFVKHCQEFTSFNFYTSDETARLLEASKIRMFGPKVVPKEDFYSFFQIIMIINKFVCTKIGPEHLEVIVVQSLDTTARTNARQDALYVLPEDLEEYSDQPATLIQTVVDLPNTDVRTLSNSMRGMVVDPNTLQIIPVGNSSSLILQGFGSNVVALVRMLFLVDEASKPAAPILPEFEVIPLEFASADELADTLEELLEASLRAARGARANQPQPQGATAAITPTETETKIMVDPRTNSLLIMAMPGEMPRIKELIARLDIDNIERERTYHYYLLENVDATEMAEVLNEFVQDSQRVQQAAQNGQAGGGQPRPAGGGSSNEVAIVADPATNSLLIAAGRTKYEEIFDLISLMDRRQDQVLIETALIELTGSNMLDLGVELGGADIPGMNEAGGFGVTSFGLSTFVDQDDDGVPDTRVPNQSQGITAGILNGDDFNLPALIVAFQERRDTNILTIPSVLVNNNGSAVVTTLDEQPTTTITGVGTAGVAPTETFGGYEQAGITLQISPTISASRYLRLNVFLEVSNFLGAVQGPIPPPRLTRTVDTTVSVPDGDTMVIGGIIVDNTSNTERQVPWLGDIPILGWLFKRETSDEDRTSLYFFVTPHIMRDKEFADLSAYSYRKKLEAADTIGADRVRMIDTRFGRDPGTAPVDFEGFNVPLYQTPQRGEVDGESIGADDAPAEPSPASEEEPPSSDE